MKKSNGYPNRILREGSAGGKDTRMVPGRDRTPADVLIAICAVAGLLLGVINLCHHCQTDKTLTRLEENIRPLKNVNSDKFSNERDRLRNLKNIKKEKKIEAGTSARALPPEEPGPVDLGSQIKMVLPKK